MVRERWPRDGILRVEIQRNSSRASVFLQYYDSTGIQEELEAEEGAEGGGGGLGGLSLAALQEEEEEEEEMTLEMFDNSSVQVRGDVPGVGGWSRKPNELLKLLFLIFFFLSAAV